jgi:hypothetical protein
VADGPPSVWKIGNNITNINNKEKSVPIKDDPVKSLGRIMVK